ncbi:MAG TPA: hypothetical protein VE690_07820, partial [Rhodopila sp.]|nr:hypothetical protein [Rhodopila sp.]
MIRRVLKWLLGIVLVLLAIPVLAVAAVLVLANTDPGRHLIENQTASLTGGMVRIEGLQGRFPDRLRVARIEVSDAKGPYVSIAGLVLDWSPLQLLHRTARVETLQAAELDVSRMPESSSAKGTGKTTSTSYSLPVAVDLQQLRIERAQISAPVAGVPAVLALTGSAQIRSLQDGTVKLDAQRLDSAGSYALAGTLTPDRVNASVNAAEPAKGLISSIAHLPDLGPISVKAALDGPKDAVGTKLAIGAGPLTASADGTVDTVHAGADLAIKAQAPAMTPAPGVGWQSVLIDAHVQGTAAAPIANGIVRIEGLSASGARIGALEANAHGTAQRVDLDAVIRDLHVPAPDPDLFAAAPITLNASAVLDAADRPVKFRLEHPLMHLEGSGHAAGEPSVQAHLSLPDLHPLAAAASTDLEGKAELDLGGRMQGDITNTTISGLVSVTGGKAPVPALIGPDGHIELAASVHGQDITVSNLTLNGKALN